MMKDFERIAWLQSCGAGLLFLMKFEGEFSVESVLDKVVASPGCHHSMDDQKDRKEDHRLAPRRL
jgi:hypothetical protein